MERLRLSFVELLRPAYVEPPPPPPPPPLPSIHIPNELIREILLLLPVKSLVRLTCVCKSWKQIISEPQFVKLHLRRSIANAGNLAYTRLLYDSFDSLSSKENWLRPRPRSDSLLFFSSQNQKGHDLYHIENGYDLIGVCNGLVSLVKWEYHFSKETQALISCTALSARVCFWNPATRLWSLLSPPLNLIPAEFALNSDRVNCKFGFGYDCLNETYKVVVVHLELRVVKVVKVYEMGSCCWRTIQSFPSMLLLCPLRTVVYVSGTLNWLAGVVNTNLVVIVSLDLGTEEYSQLSLPDSAQHPSALNDEDEDIFPILGVMKDCLCVLHNDNNKRFLIWSMKELGGHKSWTQLFNIDLFNIDFEDYIFVRAGILYYPYGFVLSKKDEVLLITNATLGDLVLYNKKENTLEFNKNSTRCGLYPSIVDWNVENYVESLVSP